MAQKILEILIPTYNRGNASIAAIDSVLNCGDDNIAVACHSNGINKELEFAIGLRPGVRYGFFPENRGALANFRKILEGSSAEYIMFLSDEDCVNSKYLKSLLSLLSNREYGVVLCNVIEQAGKPYFSVSALGEEKLTHQDLMLLFPIAPTYISGYCFRRDLLSAEVIDTAFENLDANVYPHVLLRNIISRQASIGLFASDIIVKGDETNVGGDSHDHIEPGYAKEPNQSCQLLNPRIYGKGARARQFYYMMPIIHKQLTNLSAPKRLYVNFYILSLWLNITSTAHLHVSAKSDIPSLDVIINEYRKNNGESLPVIFLYNKFLTINIYVLQKFIIKSMWMLARVFRLVFFVRRFGLFRTYRYIIQNIPN